MLSIILKEVNASDVSLKKYILS